MCGEPESWHDPTERRFSHVAFRLDPVEDGGVFLQTPGTAAAPASQNVPSRLSRLWAECARAVFCHESRLGPISIMPRGPTGDGQTRRVSSATHRAPGRFLTDLKGGPTRFMAPLLPHLQRRQHRLGNIRRTVAAAEFHRLDAVGIDLVDRVLAPFARFGCGVAT